MANGTICSDCYYKKNRKVYVSLGETCPSCKNLLEYEVVLMTKDDVKEAEERRSSTICSNCYFAKKGKKVHVTLKDVCPSCKVTIIDEVMLMTKKDVREAEQQSV